MDPTKIYDAADSLIAGMDDSERFSYFEHLRALYPQVLGAEALTSAGVEIATSEPREVILTTEQRRMKEALLEVKRDDIEGHLKRIGDEQRAQAEHPEGLSELSAKSNENFDEESKESSRIITDGILSVIDSLSYRERRVITALFGLNGEKPSTLRQVGSEFNISQRRARQIQNQAQKKIYTIMHYETLMIGKVRHETLMIGKDW